MISYTNTLFLLSAILIPTYIVFSIIPRPLYAKDEININSLLQVGYYSNHCSFIISYETYFDGKFFFKKVCDFWMNTTKMGGNYIKLMIMDTASNNEKSNSIPLIYYIFVVIKILLLMFVLCSLSYLFSKIDHIGVQSVGLMIGLLLVGSVMSNIISLHDTQTFDNIISNSAFNIDGSVFGYDDQNKTFINQNNFSNRLEFLNIVNQRNYDNYYNFDNCEKINKNNIYNIVDICCLSISFANYIILCMYLLHRIYFPSKYE